LSRLTPPFPSFNKTKAHPNSPYLKIFPQGGDAVVITTFPWIPVVIVIGVVIMADRLLNMLLVVEQARALVWLTAILAVLVIVLLILWYLKSRKGGADGKKE